MLSTQYISSPVQKKISLAEESCQEFYPLLSHYQWAFDAPGHSPRAVEIASAIMNRGNDGCCTFWRPEGYRYILPVLHSRHFEDAIAKHRKLYYVSYGNQALLYLDTDIHKAWQTVEDGRQAQSLLDRLFARFFGEPVLFTSASTLGGNDYLKVNLCGIEYEKANAIFTRAETDLQLFLAFCGNMADFEIKGTVGFLKDGEYDWGKYGKLPIHSPDWNFARLQEFRSKPPVSIHGLEALCRQIEAQVPPDVLERHKELKKNKGDEPFFKGEYFLVTPAIEQAILEKHGEAWLCMYEGGEDRDGNVWIHRKCYRPGEVPLTEGEWREARKEVEATSQKATDQKKPEPPPQSPPESQPVKAPKSPLKINIKLMDLASESDSFKRQKEALFRFARYLKRVPTVEEGLNYLHEQNLFTGPWEQHQAKRKTRVRDILKWIARTFDAGKCAQGSVNVGKYDAWAAKKFPGGLISQARSRLTEEGEIIDGQTIFVRPSFVAVFIAVCEFALITNKNQDDSLPHNRAEELWEALYAKGLVSVPFCARKWAACREEMVRHGIVVITDRDYHTGKAMKWALGPYFPFLGLWKGTKVRSPGGSPLRKERKRTTEQEHNTLLRWQSPRSGLDGRLMPARPPP